MEGVDALKDVFGKFNMGDGVMGMVKDMFAKFVTWMIDVLKNIVGKLIKMFIERKI